MTSGGFWERVRTQIKHYSIILISSSFVMVVLWFVLLLPRLSERRRSAFKDTTPANDDSPNVGRRTDGSEKLPI